MLTRLHQWLLKADSAQKQRVADRACNGSRQYLNHLAHGRRVASPDHGIAIEIETTAINKETRGELPVVYRTDVVPSCKGCDFAAKCLGTIAKRN